MNDMNDDTGGGRGRRRRPGSRRAGTLAAVAAGIALLASACGGGSSAAGSSASAATYKKALAYTRCMRSHGVPDFPDPTSQGTFVTTGIDAASNQARQANFACEYLLPNDGLPAGSSAHQEQLLMQGLKYAVCMRSHGILNFPDPVRAGDEGVAFPIAGYDPSSLQFQSANKACHGPGS
jgi:hypothetical protein